MINLDLWDVIAIGLVCFLIYSIGAPIIAFVM